MNLLATPPDSWLHRLLHGFCGCRLATEPRPRRQCGRTGSDPAQEGPEPERLPSPVHRRPRCRSSKPESPLGAQEDRPFPRPRRGRLPADHPRGDQGGRPGPEPAGQPLVRPPRPDPAGRRPADPAHRPRDGHPGTPHARATGRDPRRRRRDGPRPADRWPSIEHQAALTGEAAVQAEPRGARADQGPEEGRGRRAQAAARRGHRPAQGQRHRLPRPRGLGPARRSDQPRRGPRARRAARAEHAGRARRSARAVRLAAALARLPRRGRHADPLRPLHRAQEERRRADPERPASHAGPGPALDLRADRLAGSRPSRRPTASCRAGAS